MNPRKTMIERVARALNPEAWEKEAPSYFLHVQPKGTTKEDANRTFWESHLEDRNFSSFKARAAIEAMREPTKGMLGSVLLPREIAGQTWQAMTDAALNEEAEP